MSSCRCSSASSKQSEEIYNRYRNQKGTVAFTEEATLILGPGGRSPDQAAGSRSSVGANWRRASPPTTRWCRPWTRRSRRCSADIGEHPDAHQGAARDPAGSGAHGARRQGQHRALPVAAQQRACSCAWSRKARSATCACSTRRCCRRSPIKPQPPGHRRRGAGAGPVPRRRAPPSCATPSSSSASGIRTRSRPHIGLPVFSTIPMSPAQDAIAQRRLTGATGVRLLAIEHPDDPAVESLRSLRTAMQFAMLESPNNRVHDHRRDAGRGQELRHRQLRRADGRGRASAPC